MPVAAKLNHRTPKQGLARWQVAAIAASGMAAVVLILRGLGWLQLWEWTALDMFFRWRPPEPIDPRVVVVEIRESDIRKAGRWPISDATMATLLENIRSHNPRAIGLDLYRDLQVPPGYDRLVQVFQTTPNLIGIEKAIANHGDRDSNHGNKPLHNFKDEETRVAPPPALEERSQVGMADLLLDEDGKVRRSLLSIRQGDRTLYSLPVKLALLYLEQEGISLEAIDPQTGEVRLGKATFLPLLPNAGGYVGVNTGGYQILQNFRRPACATANRHNPSTYAASCSAFATVSMLEVLEGKIPATVMRDRVVLIGSTAESLKDRFFTSFSSSYVTSTTGVEIHANTVSQLLSAALDGRSNLGTWHELLEWLWIVCWSGIGAVVGADLRPGNERSLRQRRWVAIALLAAAGILALSSYGVFLAGWWIPFVPALIAFSGASLMTVGTVSFIERRQAEAQLLYRANYDPLTNLPNRSHFTESLREAIFQRKRRDRAKCQDSASLFAVLFLDLDGFKFVNDALGHLHGDRLLIATAQRLRKHLGSQHIIARFGGDEFTILLKNIADAEEAVRIAQSLNHSFQNPFNLDGYQIFTNVSIGIAVGTIGHTEPEDLLQAADVAMYRAKEKGRGGYEVFDVSMKDRVLERLQLENDLRWGIERQEFQVYYQPIVMLETNRVVGFEALVRWQHPHRGWISPATFIPIAEETGLIVPLGWWILNAACKQLQMWHQQFSYLQPLTLSVNLSFRQFLHADLTAQIQHTLQETGVDPSTLKLEITESAVMQNPQSAIATLNHLKELGLHLSIDDFGTGYSSLSYLYRLPLDTLKVDRAFVDGMESDREKLEIVRTIILLARGLHMEVTAEGVETCQQARLLKKLGCDYGQGYLYSRPVPPEVAETYIKQKCLIV